MDERCRLYDLSDMLFDIGCCIGRILCGKIVFHIFLYSVIRQNSFGIIFRGIQIILKLSGNIAELLQGISSLQSKKNASEINRRSLKKQNHEQDRSHGYASEKAKADGIFVVFDLFHCRNSP